MFDYIAAEDAWWDEYCTNKDAMEREALRRATDSADLWEFDSEIERDAYIEAEYEALLEEMESGR